MNGLQLESVFRKNPFTSASYAGIFNALHVPKYLDRGKFFVVNTSKSPLIMGHWIAFVNCTREGLIFVDSLGRKPSHYKGKIAEFYEGYRGKKSVLTNVRLQQEDSLVCGAYVVYFVYFILKKYPHKRILREFTFNRKKNDTFVEYFLYKLSGTHVKCDGSLCPHSTFNTPCIRKYCECRHCMHT